MRLLLIRHGESVANAEGRRQGQVDSPLSDRGRRQARALAHRLADEGPAISAMYASDLKRAAETAEIVVDRLGVPLTLDARWREYDWGVLSGLIWREVEHLYPELWHQLHHSSELPSIPGEEGLDPFHQRLASALADVHASHQDGETVAIVSHGGSLGMALAQLLGMEIRRPIPFRFDNTSLSIVEYGSRGPYLALHNDTCHLEASLK